MAENIYEQHKQDHPPSGVTNAAPETETAPEQSPGLMATVGRGLGLGTRDVLEGALGPPYDAIGAGINYGAGLAGQPPLIAPFSENLTRLGLPESTTPAEKTISGVTRPAAGVLPVLGTGAAMTRAASPIVRSAGELLSTQPAGQVVAAGAGGATEQATGSPTAGAAVSMGLPFAGSLLKAAGRELEHAVLSGGITPDNARLGMRAIDRYGIPIAANDLSDNSMVRIGADQGGRVPLSGVEAADRIKHQAWQGAIAREMGERDATAFTPDVLTRARDRIGATFNDVAARTTIPPEETATLRADLDRILFDSKGTLLSNEVSPVQEQIANIKTFLTENGDTLSGDAYQKLTNSKSQLSKLERQNSNPGDVAGDIRDAIDDAFARSARPNDQAALQEARYQYRVMRTVDQLAAGSRGGDITPLGFMQKVKAASQKFDPPTGGLAYTGGGNIGELARIGTLMRPAPQTGTADRAMITALVAGGPAAVWANPGAAAMAGGGIAANRMLQGYLRNPETSVRLAEGVINPGAGPRINRLSSGLNDAALLSGVAGAERDYQNPLLRR